MAQFHEVIKKFNKIRIYLKDLLIYGYKRRDQFLKKSKRTYDDERRRICSYLGEFVKESYGKNGKQIFISMSTSMLLTNPLYRCYETKSFTSNDIQLHFYLLDQLQNEEEMDLGQLSDSLVDHYGAEIDVQLISRKLKEYSEMGIFFKRKENNRLIYSLADDIFEDFRDDYREQEKDQRGFSALSGGGSEKLEKREELEMFLGFYAMEPPLSLIGNYIQRSLQMKNKWFLFEHYFIGWTLEDEVLASVLEAIHSRRVMEVKTFPNKNQEVSVYHAVPFFIMESVQNGRRYIASYHEERKQYTMIRMDYIEQIQVKGTCEEYLTRKEEALQIRKKSWGASWNGKEEKKLHTLRFQIWYEEHRENYLYQKLKNESRNGQVTKKGHNRLEFFIQVWDPIELMPWMRTFLGRICELECSDPVFLERFHNDLEKMRQMYEIREEENDGNFS